MSDYRASGLKQYVGTEDLHKNEQVQVITYSKINLSTNKINLSTNILAQNQTLTTTLIHGSKALSILIHKG